MDDTLAPVLLVIQQLAPRNPVINQVYRLLDQWGMRELDAAVDGIAMRNTLQNAAPEMEPRALALGLITEALEVLEKDLDVYRSLKLLALLKLAEASGVWRYHLCDCGREACVCPLDFFDDWLFPLLGLETRQRQAEYRYFYRTMAGQILDADPERAELFQFRTLTTLMRVWRVFDGVPSSYGPSEQASLAASRVIEEVRAEALEAGEDPEAWDEEELNQRARAKLVEKAGSGASSRALADDLYGSREEVAVIRATVRRVLNPSTGEVRWLPEFDPLPEGAWRALRGATRHMVSYQTENSGS